MTEHTPGPWRTVEGDSVVAIFAGDQPVADTSSRRYYEQFGATELANARLIAAAPELLALLKRYRAETPLGHQPHMIAHEADAVIAKATAPVQPDVEG